jgi:hypothetical protein
MWNVIITVYFLNKNSYFEISRNIKKPPKVKKHQHTKILYILIVSYKTFHILTTVLFLYLSSSPAKLLKVSRTVLSAWIVLHLCSAWTILPSGVSLPSLHSSSLLQSHHLSEEYPDP